jgi:L-amino acid N-acyltransferase YncA
LNALSVDDREKQWKARITEAKTFTGVADERGELVGFVTADSTRDLDKDSATTGEITALYVTPERWAKGAGTLLCRAACAELVRQGKKEVTLWGP